MASRPGRHRKSWERFVVKRLLQSNAGTYLVALAAVAVGAAVRLALDPWLDGEYLFTLSYAAIAITVWVGGYGPGILATVLAYVLANLLFLRPAHGLFDMLNLQHAVALATYLVDCSVIIAVGEVLRHATSAANYDRDFLDLALKAANMNTFDVDLEGRTARRSGNAARFYGLTETNAGRDVFLDNIHPEDKQKHIRTIQESRTTGKEFFSRYRYIRPVDKRVMWVEARGRVIRDKTGKARMIGTATDVTERLSLEKQLAEHAEALALANNRKSQFIATLAHELRNPLAPINACINLLKNARTNEHSRVLALQIVERQTARLERLIEDLLDVSRIEQGKISLRLDRIDIARIVDKAVEASRPYIDAKSQSLSVRLPEKPLFVRVDEERMVQVFNNVLNNSCKFTPEGGSITIRVTEDNGRAKITVTDDGIGIPTDALTAIFETYIQLGTQTGVSKPGIGLGLALAKAIVQLHRGNIEAKSEGVGKGSEFTVTLPTEAAERQQS